MRLTNVFHLPQPLVDAVRNDPYSKGDADYSVTGLLKPPRIAQLEREHDDELEEDVSDRIWSLCGQVVHGILERAERTALAEKRLYATINGVRISGAIDRLVLVDKKLQDYKFITLRKIKDGVPKEYEEQQNAYVWLLRQSGYEVQQAELVCILRDWNRPASRFRDDYPPHHVALLPVRLWGDAETERFLAHRVQIHEAAKTQLPECNADDRWAEPDVWAVMAPGRKRAVALYNSEREALEHVAAFDGENYYVDHRRGNFGKRCQDYCRVNKWCAQFQRHKSGG